MSAAELAEAWVKVFAIVAAIHGIPYLAFRIHKYIRRKKDAHGET